MDPTKTPADPNLSASVLFAVPTPTNPPCLLHLAQVTAGASMSLPSSPHLPECVVWTSPDRTRIPQLRAGMADATPGPMQSRAGLPRGFWGRALLPHHPHRGHRDNDGSINGSICELLALCKRTDYRPYSASNQGGHSQGGHRTASRPEGRPTAS